MDRISRSDAVLLLLRERLLGRERASRQRGAAKAQSRTPGEAAPRQVAGLDTVQALAAVDGVDDSQLGRALIQGLLAEQFGAEMLNEAKFQQVVDRVHRALGEDAEAGKLLARLIGELRGAASTVGP